MANNNRQNRRNNRRVDPKTIANNVVAATPDNLNKFNIPCQSDEALLQEEKDKKNRDQKKGNYVSKARSKYGDDWHVRISDYEIKFKAAPKMIRDLSYFNVDPVYDGIYYKVPRLLQAMMSLAYSKVYYYTTLVTATQLLIDNLRAQGPYQPEIETVLLNVKNKLLGWSCVESGLNQLVINPDYVGVLTNLQVQLRDSRCNL